MSTIAQIDRACREGVFVYTSNRQRIAGAVANYHGVEAAKDHVWVHMWKTGIWDEIPLSAITTEPVQSKENVMATAEKVTDISGKRSGKRGGGGHTSLPSESAARAAGNGKERKGDATSSMRDLGEIVGAGELSTEAAAPPAEAAGKSGKKKSSAPKERKPRAVVTYPRSKANYQGFKPALAK